MEVDAVPKRRRADATRNRRRLLEAAQAAFAEHGLAAPLEDVAGRAGVGIGTLYRHFGSRDDLIAACFESRVAEYARAAEEALEAPDGWTGFSTYVQRICGMQAADRGLKDVLTRTFPTARTLEANRARGFELFLQLVERAKAEGTLRADFVPEDHVLLLMGNAGVVQATGDTAPDAWRRYVGIMLDGLRAEGATRLPPPATPRQVIRAMLRLNKARAKAADPR